jgi:RNA polymerase sigma-70 factor (ECF subfamily)
VEDIEVVGIARAKLEEAYKAQKGRLHRFLRYKVGDEAASDMVQDAFLRMANTGHVDQIEEPAAYLWRVARNLLFERWRTQKHENVVFLPLEEDRHAVSAPEQEWALEEADLRQLYKAAIDSLPDKTRYVFMMCRLDGMTHKQIAEALGITVATVEYHMGKALTYLARAVDAGR